MRNGYRHPLAGTILMALVFALLIIFFVTTRSIAPFGRSVALMLGAAIGAATIVTLVRFALRRTGAHRLAEVRTWPQH